MARHDPWSLQFLAQKTWQHLSSKGEIFRFKHKYEYESTFLASRDKYVQVANVVALPSASVSWTKTLTLAITSKPEVIDLSYCTCVFLVTWPFTWYHNFLPWSVTYFWKTLTLAITFEPEVIWLSYCICVSLVTKTFHMVPLFIFWLCDLELWPTFEKL